MGKTDYLIKTPWDSKIFGINTYEVVSISDEVMKKISGMKGHFTVRISPALSSKVVNDYGFYYCDTLIEPYCSKQNFKCFGNKDINISYKSGIDNLMKISNGAFICGRFHRDFNIDKKLADLRYDNWLKEFYKSGNVLGLIYKNDLAGFWCVAGNKIRLHAIGKNYKGKGLGKYLWSAACMELFRQGHKELISSISTSNAAILNLYASLGFKFRNPVDIYHKLNR